MGGQSYKRKVFYYGNCCYCVYRFGFCWLYSRHFQIGVRNMGKIERLAVRHERGKDVYTIRTLVDGLTANELIDLCDPNNWGGYVSYLGFNQYTVVVYTD
jgi:hypothetical protein